MFLSKKTAAGFNKPKTQETIKPKRVLGGWNDDDQQEKQAPPTKQTSPPTNQAIVDLLDNNTTISHSSQQPSPAIIASQPSKQDYFDWDALNERSDIDIEKGLVEEIVKPSGIKIKPSDVVLNDFLKEVKFLEPAVIGSLLLSKIEVNYPFQVKAKALYSIEFLLKRNQDYKKYFQKHSEKLKEFPEPQDNIENYRKILKTVMNVIGVSVSSTQQQVKMQFSDPGYNTEQIETHLKSDISTFIHQNANKPKKNEANKFLVGPGQNKQKNQPKKQVNLLEIDISQTNSNQESLV